MARQRLLPLLRDTFTKNLLLKLLSLAIAVVLWSREADDEISLMSASIPLEVKIPDRLAILVPPPKVIQVELRALSRELDSVDPHLLRLEMDLSDAQPGVLEFDVTRHPIAGLPRGIEVASFSPSELRLEIDEVLKKKLRVSAALEGTASEGYEVGEVKVQPALMMFSGPKSLLDDLSEVSTQSISLNGQEQTFEDRYRLNLPNKGIKPVGHDETVRVQVRIKPKLTEFTFDAVPIVIPETLQGVALFPGVASVVLRGPSPLVKSLKQEHVRIFLEEGSMPLTELRAIRSLEYPSKDDGRGLPRIRVTWTHERELELVKVVPSSFRLKVTAVE